MNPKRLLAITHLPNWLFDKAGRTGAVELVSRPQPSAIDKLLDRGFRSCLDALPSVNERCVIINVHTEALTEIAARSGRSYGVKDLLLIDCSPTPTSRQTIGRLGSELEATVIEAPLRRHGSTLDVLLAHLKDERVLLLDSDAELRSRVIDRMRAELHDPFVYGSGWIHGPSWLPGVFGNVSHVSRQTGWYLQRPWMPCVLLRRQPIADALALGASFREGVIPNDLPALPWLSRVLLTRFYIPGLRRWRLAALERFRNDFDGVRPNYCYADTGALMHQALTQRGFRFAGPHVPPINPDVAHAHGATRMIVGP